MFGVKKWENSTFVEVLKHEALDKVNGKIVGYLVYCKKFLANGGEDLVLCYFRLSYKNV